MFRWTQDLVLGEFLSDAFRNRVKLIMEEAVI